METRTLTSEGGNFNNLNRPSWDRPNWSNPNWNRPGWGIDPGFDQGNWHNQWHDHCVHPHYHGWYNGCWTGYWNSNWYAPIAWGAVGWGLGSVSSNIFSAPVYVNPYYVTDTVASVPYDYSQPVVVNNFIDATDPNIAQAPSASSPPQDGLSQFDAGLAAFKKGSYVVALSEFDAALKLLPNDPVLHEVRALALFASGRYVQSAVALNSLLASAPGMDWTTMSSLYGNPNDYTDQLRALEAYASSNSKDPASHFVLAYHYLVIGEKDPAIASLRIVVANQPDDMTAKRMLEALSPSETSVPQTASKAPAPPTASESVVASEQSNAPETDLVGNWSAKAGGTIIELSISGDSKFSWKAIQQDSSVVELKGDLTAASDAIQLETPDQGSLGGKVVSQGADQWQLVPPGAPAGDKGLMFMRKK